MLTTVGRGDLRRVSVSWRRARNAQAPWGPIQSRHGAGRRGEGRLERRLEVVYSGAPPWTQGQSQTENVRSMTGPERPHDRALRSELPAIGVEHRPEDLAELVLRTVRRKRPLRERSW